MDLPSIEVTISPELRRLYAKSHGAPEKVSPARVIPAVAKRPIKGEVCLRVDGSRPFRFNGVKVMTFAGDLSGSNARRLTVDVYQDDDAHGYLALTLNCDEAKRRPNYACVRFDEHLAEKVVLDALASLFIGDQSTTGGTDQLQQQSARLMHDFNKITKFSFKTEWLQ